MTKELKDTGEEGAWELMRPFMARADSGKIIATFGDDTAAIKFDPGSCALLTCDMLVEGVHFRRDLISWKDLGRKAIAVNVSDVAAMGGQPKYALVALGMPPSFLTSDLRALYRGMAAEGKKHGAALIGGDTVRSRAVVISIALVGSSPANQRLALRSNCRAGQTLYVTGTLGDSAAGLALLTNRKYKKFLNEPWAKTLIRRHRLPAPRLQTGIALAESIDDLAMIDVSDSLAQSCKLLAEASKVAIEIDAKKLPLSRALKQFAAATGEDPHGYALHGGEDYELLFGTGTASGRLPDSKSPLTPIGQACGGTAGLRMQNAIEPKMSFRHF